MFRDLVLANRSYRRFHEEYAIERQELIRLVGLARCTASGANLQPLKYVLSCTRERNELIFPSLAWAGYLTDWGGPAPGERPSAYIVILGDKEIRSGDYCDHGIAAQTILLGATEAGLGGCMIGAINRERLRNDLNIPERFDILLVIALGKPSETVVLEDVRGDGSIKYYRDANDVHHVPKRTLDEIIVDF